MQSRNMAKIMTLALLISLLCGCSANEDSVTEISSLNWEKIEESPDSELSEAGDVAQESTSEYATSGNTDDNVEDIAEDSEMEATLGETADGGDTMPEAYRKIIDTMCDAMKKQDVTLDMECDYLPAEYYQGYSVGYDIRDINGDGTEELLLETKHEQYEDSFIYAMFTLKSGEAVQLFNYGGCRNRYYLCTDGTVRNEGSSGAAYSAWIFYRLIDNELVLQECVVTAPDKEDETKPCWYYSTTNTNPEEGESTVITDEKANEIQNRYTVEELHMTVLE